MTFELAPSGCKMAAPGEANPFSEPHREEKRSPSRTPPPQREEDVATVRISVIRQQQDRPRLVTPHTTNHQGPQRRRQLDAPRRPLFRLRACYCCLVVPFFLAFALTIISTVTFVVKNEEAKKNCEEIECVLTSSDDPRVYLADCWLVQGGGAFVGVVLVIFITSLTIRMCLGTKLRGACILVEFLVLLIVLGLHVMVAVTLTIRSNDNLNCKSSFKNDLLDFLRQSEFTAWASSGLLTFITVTWILMLLLFMTCTRRVEMGPTERDPLLQ